MSLITTGIVSFTVIATNVGFVNQFWEIWVKSWLIGYIVAVPSILLIAPQIEKLVAHLFKEEKIHHN